jgi:hypothetical protein
LVSGKSPEELCDYLVHRHPNLHEEFEKLKTLSVDGDGIAELNDNLLEKAGITVFGRRLLILKIIRNCK